ncbi:MAG TPA: neprosin family prolyl endopeptidase, partial [Polyangiaceae bacterium]|nr:neprosin family prolyl endopeptidase [Polyangiaceae bacterium]
YSWDNMDGQFVANPIRRHQPGEIVRASVLDETMVEHLLTIFQSPTNDWCIAYNGDLLGYYPASLFTMLNKGACVSAWYGEIARVQLTANPGWVMTEMGSGEFANAGLLYAAHVRDPKYYDLTWAPVTPTEDPPFSKAMTPNKPLCYSRSKLTYIAAPWDSMFLFLGGPGGKNPGCTWP